MQIEPTYIDGLFIVMPRVFEDARGYFFESYNESVFQAKGFSYRWVQDNQSASTRGVIRGLHFQAPPFAQTKLIRVLQGSILDVAVDIRKGSATYGQHVALELSAENKKQFLIPPGFAHGFSVLSPKAEVMYKCDQFYNKDSEGGLLFDDPALCIDWKIPAGEVILSEKDRVLPILANFHSPF
ncbi:MAG: dTDP-4-dehydrorhamnose 3,5-epimerase [Bacteroidetes bacterium]|nr:dTDP-4-dehydrorhamnose 3,5-epimerase [Bacteroidota bacterium]